MTEIRTTEVEVVPGAAPFDEQAPREDVSQDLESLHIQRKKTRREVEAARQWEELKARQQSEMETPALADPSSPGEAEEGGVTAGDVARDVGTGVIETPLQTAGGMSDAVQESVQTIADVEDFITGTLKMPGPGDLAEPLVAITQALLPDIEAADSVTGNAVRNIAKFMTGFFLAGKLKPIAALGKAKGGAVLSPLAKGAVADFTVFDPQEDRLSDLIQAVPALQNPINEFLAADPEDTAMEGRFKNLVEGMGLGLAAEGLLRGLKALRSVRSVRQAATANQLDMATVQSAVDAAEPVARLEDAIQAREGFAYRILTGPELEDAIDSGLLRPGPNAAGVVNFSEKPIPLFGGSATKQAGIVVEVPLSAIPHERTFPGSGDVFVQASEDIPLEAASRVFGIKFPGGGKGIQVADVTPTISGAAEHAAVRQLTETTESQRKNLAQLLGDPEAPTFEVRPLTEVVGQEEAAARAVKGAKKKAETDIFVNWSRINSPEDVKAVMQDMADALAPRVTKARRGKRTWEQTKLSAEQKNAWDIMATRRTGEPLNAEQTVAVRELWARSAEALRTSAKELLGDPRSEVRQIAFRKMMSVHAAIQDQVIAARTETARALNAWAIPAGDSVAFAGHMDELKSLLRMESKNTFDLAERLTFLADQGLVKEADAFVYGSAWAKSSDMIRQLFYSAMLSSPHTHVRNIIGNTAAIPIQMVERRVANIIGQAFGAENVARGEDLSMMFGAIQGFRRAFQVSAKGRKAFTEAMRHPSRARAILAENAEEFGPFFRSAATGESGFGLGKVELPRQGAFDPEKLMGGDDALARGMRKADDALARGFQKMGLDAESPLGRVAMWTDTMSNVPMRSLAAADEVFKSVAADMELNAVALRKAMQEVDAGKITMDMVPDRVTTLVQNPDEYMRMARDTFARVSTFTNEPLATPVWKLVQQLQRVPVLGRLVMPFTRTPQNLGVFTFSRTPLAPFVRQWRQDILEGGAKADLAWSKMLVGSSVLFAMGDLALKGHITGQGPEKSAQRKTLQRAGWQPNSVRVQVGTKKGEPQYRYFSYRSLEPVSTPLGLAANIVDLFKYKDWDDDDVTLDELVIASSLAIAQKVTDQTYMMGLAGLFDAVGDPQRYGEGWWNRTVGVVIPRGVAQIARQQDPTVRMVDGMIDSLRRQTPGLSKDLPILPDLWGRPINRESGLGDFYDLVSPVYSRQQDPEPIDTELMRLELYIGKPARKTTFQVDLPSGLTQSATIDLKDRPAMHSRYTILAGNELTHDIHGAPVGLMGLGLKDELNALIEGKHPLSEVYEIMSDGPEGGKADMIRDMVNDRRRAAREVMLQEFPELELELKRRAGKRQTGKFNLELR